MNIDALPDQFEEFVAHARGVLNQHISEVSKIVDKLNGEKTAAANALAELKGQCTLAQSQLDQTLAHLVRASDLGSLDSEITRAKTDLAALRAESEKATTALAALAKERTEREAQVTALANEARRFTNQRAEAEAYVANIKMQLRSIQIGQQL